MIYTAIDTFYLTEEELKTSPSRKDNIDEATETTLRIYGCDVIQESGILLRLPQAVMATGQVLFHRFYCKKSFGRFNVKRVSATCVWLASKLEESPRKARHVLHVFHRMECRRENLPLEHLDSFSKKYSELKMDLIRTERHLLKEMGFICHVEHPHKFISNYLATLETPPELRQEAWNLANDSLRTTLCVRFKSAVVACGVVYAAARRFGVPLPENPAWWKAFDADKSGIDEVCRVLAHLYTLPKARYIHVCKDSGCFTNSTRAAWDSSPSHPVPKEAGLSSGPPQTDDNTIDSGGSKDVAMKTSQDKLKEPRKSDDDSQRVAIEIESKEASSKQKLPERNRSEPGGERRERERSKGRDLRERRDSDRDSDRAYRSKDKAKDSGHVEKLKHHSSRDREYYSSYPTREKDRHRHHSYS